jgi:ribosomal protein S8
MNTDPIADMLTRIRNALVAGHDFTDMPASKLKLSLAETLKREGFIRDFEVLQEEVRRIIRIHLAYADKREPVITGIQRVSKPSPPLRACSPVRRRAVAASVGRSSATCGKGQSNGTKEQSSKRARGIIPLLLCTIAPGRREEVRPCPA